MATLFVIRHGLTGQTGKTLYGQTGGIDLDDRGRSQADALVDRFADVNLTALYSSPLERCVQTVEPLAAASRLPVVVRDDLIEMDAGSWTGKSLARLRTTKAWREVHASPSTFRFPGGGEGFADAQARVVAAMQAIARRHRRGRVAVATHGDIARLFLAHAQGIPLDGFQRLVIDTASVSVVQRAGDGWRVLLMNDTGGLARFGATPAPPWEARRPRTTARRVPNRRSVRG
ncbi:MAG TPA: histidine phosphatase family protein [Actinomycetota bacterium]|nr:histidine phosphatase family protein [Actinomycetota bacterium]